MNQTINLSISDSLLALRELITGLKLDGASFFDNLDPGAYTAIYDLRDTCEEFLERFEDTVAQQEPEWDGQPDEAQEWHDFDPDC